MSLVPYSDHDYGCDNADKNFPHKVETTTAFLEFTGESKDSPMTQRASRGKGVYGVKLFDFDRPESPLVPDMEACIDPDVPCLYPTRSYLPEYSNKTVAVFVLDVRTNKDPWMEGTQAYYTRDNFGDFLGEEQWEWFESAISKSRAAVNVIVNGLQVNSNLFPNPNIAESWAGFPRSQQRLFDTILADSVASPILISGDVHMTQMMRKDCRRRDNMGRQRPVIEMTTSGMTHSWGRLHSPPIDEPNYQYPIMERVTTLVGTISMHIMHQLRPWTQLLVSSDDPSITHDGGLEGAKKGLQYSLERNFGELEFNWEEQTIAIRSIGEDGKPLLSSKVSMNQLNGFSQMDTSGVTEEDFRAASMEGHPWSSSEWVCVSHRGRVGMGLEMLGHIRTVGAIGACFALPLLLPVYLLILLWRKHKRSTSTLKRQSSPPALRKLSF